VPCRIEIAWPLPPQFAFVQRILKLEPGRGARGECVVPRLDPSNLPSGETGPRMPPSLATEAVGQLAGWVAMAAAEFRRRPVAGLAGELAVNESACAGHSVELEVEVDRCDADAVAYSGRAWCEGRCLVELRRSVGPMLPMEEFDDPAAVARQFRTLCDREAVPAAETASLVRLPIEVVALEPGRALRAEVRLPTTAPWFVGHFPRKPVMPGTLLVDVQARLATELAATIEDAAPGPLRAARARGVKLRAFIPPGALVVFDATVRASRRNGADVVLEGTVDGSRVSSLRVEVIRRDQS